MCVLGRGLVGRLLIVFALVAGVTVPCMGAPTAAHLRCEWRVNNQAVGDICPEFCWEAEGQRACQVLVATSEDKLPPSPRLRGAGAPGQADAWDSEKVESRLPIIEYAGEALANEMTYFWKVHLWGEDDEAGAWSEVQRFTTKFEPLPSLPGRLPAENRHAYVLRTGVSR